MKRNDIGTISIAIPTRNREKVIPLAIRRCLEQSYRDIEVVIVDNGDNDATLAAVRESADRRIRYVRTGGLPMADNWQAALESCSGEYVYIIADKILLHEQTMEVLAQAINRFGYDSYSFLHAAGKLTLPPADAEWVTHETRELTERATTGDISLYQDLGFRGYTLAVSRSLVKRIVQRHGKISWPVSPDFTMAFLVSFHTEKFAFKPWCPFDYNYNYASNGFSSMYGGGLARSFLQQYGISEQDAVRYAPIKLYTVWNSVLSDFYHVCEMVGLAPGQVKVDIAACWKALYAEIMHHHLLTHIDMSDKLRVMYELVEQTPDLQNEGINEFINSYSLVPEGRTTVPPAAAGRRSILERVAGKARRLLR